MIKTGNQNFIISSEFSIERKRGATLSDFGWNDNEINRVYVVEFLLASIPHRHFVEHAVNLTKRKAFSTVQC